MRSSIFFAAPLVALAAAQSGTTTADAFPLASLLTQTDSRGVVTGQPAVQTSQPSIPAVVTSQPSVPAVVTSQPGLPAAVTSQPAVDSIPAGLSQGLHTLNNGNTSFIISIGSSTTIVNPVATSSSIMSSIGAVISSITGTDGRPTPTTLSMTTNTQMGEGTSTSKPAAAAGLQAVSGAMAGAAAVIALWL